MSNLRSWAPPLVKLIFAIVAVHLLVGTFVHIDWLRSGNQSVLRYYFDYLGSFVLIGFSVLEIIFGLLVYRQFSPGQPLRTAWLFITIAGGCHLTSSLLKHLLSVNSAINPLVYFLPSWHSPFAVLMQRVGEVVGGPVHMSFLIVGLFVSLRFYRGMGMLAKLRPADLVFVCFAMGYGVTVMVGIIMGLRNQSGPVQYSQALTWPGDYLLFVLLLEAIFLRRSALEMGSGYASRIWGAFAVGIFITTMCSFLNWLTAYGVLDWRQTAFVWYLWYPASAAFAIAPAYQWEATRTARLRLLARTEDLKFTAA